MERSNGYGILETKIDDLKDRFHTLKGIVRDTEKTANRALNIAQQNQQKVEAMETLLKTEMNHFAQVLGSKIDAVGAKQKEQSERRWKIITMILGAIITIGTVALLVSLGFK